MSCGSRRCSPLPARRWRGALAAHPVRVDNNGGLAALDYPAGWFNAVQGPLILVLLGLSLAFIARQALSWRRATGERRQQLKWLASGAAISIICLFLAASSNSSGNGPTLWGVLGTLAWMGVAALPVSIGVAILKYRLYEIDRIISRTLAYAIVTGLLVGVYAGLVLLATQVLKFHSTVAVAALHAGRGGAVQPGAPAGAARRGPPVQPGPLRRRAHGDGVRGPAAGHGRPRCGPRRPGQRSARRR